MSVDNASRVVIIPDLIVTRHPGAVDWLATQLPLPNPDKDYWWARNGEYLTLFAHNPEDLASRAIAMGQFDQETGEPCTTNLAPEPLVIRSILVVAEATADQVRHKRVIGNLPLHLCAKASMVTVIEFGSTRGCGEFTREQMIAAGAKLASYVVITRETAIGVESGCGIPLWDIHDKPVTWSEE